MTIQELIIEIKNLTENMFQNTYNVYMKFNDIFPYIRQYYQEFIVLIPDLNRIGMEIDANKMLEQLRGLSNAIERKDRVMLFDTLYYEITDTMSLYNQIKEIMEQE
ncbi:MAG: hypothetical protein K1W19_14830 [Lachnospiraceae bacterium]|jgi:hypothetical protein|nr:hypothetical protein [Lachnospiraceae bacterium]MCI8825668.1 hypothetical protein [Lachnospiraceae bacterium]MCI9368750.1 hypothetical protein [Lachnospiraceae bacterium]